MNGAASFAGFVAMGLLACSGAVAPTAGALDAAAFVEGGARLSQLRGAAASPRTDNVSIQLAAPYLPSAIKARGAIAVDPPRRLRMILLGPGGTTAMDLWISDGRFRFEVPAIERVVRGDEHSSAEQKRGLPVDFLQTWMLDPVGGRLLAARRRAESLELLLERHDGDIVELSLEPRGGVRLHRSSFDARQKLVEEEWVVASGIGCESATYRQRSTQLEVTARCESSRSSVSERAFQVPEEGGRP